MAHQTDLSTATVDPALTLEKLCPKLLKRLRGQRTQGQVARRMKVSSAVVHNWESGKSRIPLDVFLEFCTHFGVPFREALVSVAASLGQLDAGSPAALLRTYRRRLKWSQAAMARALGFRSVAMIHHFEKGTRVPSLVNLMQCLILAGDDCKALVLQLTNDQAFANHFPAGGLPEMPDVDEYWGHFYVSALRQIMRTTRYRQTGVPDVAKLAGMLKVTESEIEYGIRLLERLELVVRDGATVLPKREVRLLKPKSKDPKLLFQLKKQWLRYLDAQLRPDAASGQLFTVDQLPMNPQIFAEVVRLVRALQDDLHKTDLKETTGLGSLIVLGHFNELPEK